jgi:hypothetical protein
MLGNNSGTQTVISFIFGIERVKPSTGRNILRLMLAGPVRFLEVQTPLVAAVAILLFPQCRAVRTSFACGTHLAMAPSRNATRLRRCILKDCFGAESDTID